MNLVLYCLQQTIYRTAECSQLGVIEMVTTHVALALRYMDMSSGLKELVLELSYTVYSEPMLKVQYI